MIKKQFIIYVLILAFIGIAQIETIGFSSAKRRIFDDYMRMVAVSNTGDSLLSVPPDSVRLFIATQLSDSINALDSRTIARLDSFSAAKVTELRDSIIAVEARVNIVISDSTAAMLDSARVVLSDAKTYAEQVWIDSSGQSVVVIPNTLKNENNINIDATGDNLLKLGAVGDGSNNVWLFGEDKSDGSALKIDYYNEFSDGFYIAKFNTDYSTDIYNLRVDSDIIASDNIEGESVYEGYGVYHGFPTAFKNEWVRIASAEDLSTSNYAYFDLEWWGDWLNDTPAPPCGYLRFSGNAQFMISADIGDTSGVQITMLKSTFSDPEIYRLITKIRVITKDRTAQNESSPAYLEAYVQIGDERHFSLKKNNSQDWTVLHDFISSPGIPAGYSAYEVSTANAFSITNYDSSFEIDHNSNVTIDGYVYKKKEPFAKFKRTTTFTPSAADTWLRVPICEPSGLHNTPHFTCAADSSIVIGRAMMLNITSAVKKYVGVNSVEKVLFRFVKGAISGGRIYSICGQQKENVAKAVGDEFTVSIPPSDMGFAAGDSLWLEMKTTDVGIILQPDTDFENPASATMNIKYLFDL